MNKTLFKVVLVAMVMSLVFASCSKEEDVRDKYIGEWKYECQQTGTMISCATNDTSDISNTITGTIKIEKGAEKFIKIGEPINQQLIIESADNNGTYKVNEPKEYTKDGMNYKWTVYELGFTPKYDNEITIWLSKEGTVSYSISLDSDSKVVDKYSTYETFTLTK